MKLENQVSNLELSRKLKEFGVKQESIWYFSKPYKIHKYDVFKSIQSYSLKANTDSPPISAFTASEAIEILGEEITIPKNTENVANFIASKIVDKLSAKV
ncbi:MAG TPA: hypothetical protein ENH85_00455 [Candidatus Scalindua sp.]|nr:hypothetical protein [Candidatus Scalindua sp.]